MSRLPDQKLTPFAVLHPMNNANLPSLSIIGINPLNQNISGQPAADPFFRPHGPVTKMGIVSHKSPKAEACALKSQARASDFAKRKLCLVCLKKTLEMFQVIEIPHSDELYKSLSCLKAKEMCRIQNEKKTLLQT